MIPLRVAFYVLFVVLGAIILVRMLAYGVRMETLTGIVLGGLLIALGVYRLTQVFRIGASRR
jgi:hypothetical protein